MSLGDHASKGISYHFRDVAKAVPIEQLLTETDNPGGQKWLTGVLGMPRIIKDIIQALAEIKDTEPEFLTQAIENNFSRLIGDDPRLIPVKTRFGERRTK